ncbi:MAG: dockerin type I domain-containing protein [Bacillota bacterium]|nr:dockerin type I domain-containing protein [Bacillota bacterium]
MNGCDVSRHKEKIFGRTGKGIRFARVLPAVLMALLFSLPASAAAQDFDIEPMVAAGSNHSLAVRGDGSVWAWGYNGYGQLGNDSHQDSHIPIRVNDLDRVVAVSAGNGYSVALREDGSVWAWGRNSSGQLGNATRTDRDEPKEVYNLTGVKAISAGYAHTLALKSDGSVWAWGYNGYGQIGDGSKIDRTIPVKVPGLSGVVAVSAGYGHSLALKSDGSVWAWGKNDWGQLGDNTTSGRTMAVKVANLANIIAISAGQNHSLALHADGTVWAWGRNSSGQLGIGTTIGQTVPAQIPELSGVLAISAGENFSTAVRVTGSLWAWGRDGLSTMRIWPVQLTTLNSMKAVNTGGNHTLALKSDNSVWAWGNNSNGQLGNDSTASSADPVKVAFQCIVTTKVYPAGGGTAAGGGVYDHGDRVTLVATAGSGYSFVNWTEQGEDVTTKNSYSFTVTDDRTLEANFRSVFDLLKDYLKDNYTGTRVEKSTTGTVLEDDYSDVYSYRASAGDNLLFVLGWAETDSDLDLEVYKPYGSEVNGHKTYTVGDTKIVILEVEEAVAGTWTYKVFGEDTPTAGQLYTVLVARSDQPFDDDTSVGNGLGDVDGNGRININDVVMVMRDILALETLSYDKRLQADVNEDGRVDIVDVALMQRRALGLISSF